MKIPDFSLKGQKVTRLEVVKSAAGEFIARRKGDRLGLIVFGSQAYVQTPLTFDRNTVKNMLTETVIGRVRFNQCCAELLTIYQKRATRKAHNLQQHAIVHHHHVSFVCKI